MKEGEARRTAKVTNSIEYYCMERNGAPSGRRETRRPVSPSCQPYFFLQDVVFFFARRPQGAC